MATSNKLTFFKWKKQVWFNMRVNKLWQIFGWSILLNKYIHTWDLISLISLMNVMFNELDVSNLLLLFVINHRVSAALLAHLEFRATVELDFLDQRSAVFTFLTANSLKFPKITANKRTSKLGKCRSWFTGFRVFSWVLVIFQLGDQLNHHNTSLAEM